MTPLASNTPSAPCQLVWLRRDLRLEDHAALAEALEHPEPIVPVFVFDRDILDGLPANDRRVAFLHQTLGMLQSELVGAGGGLLVVHGRAQQAIPLLAKALGAVRIICAEDYEPQAIARDQAVAKAMAADGMDLVQVQDQCLFAKQQLLTGAGRPFSVFTPYKNAWLKAFTPEQASERSTTGLAQALVHPTMIDAKLACMPASDAIERVGVTRLPSLEEMGFAEGAHDASSSPQGKAAPLQAGPAAAQALLQDFVGRMGQYKDARDFPAKKGPSYLSVHLRFGTISTRACVRQAMGLIQADPAQAVGAQTWLS